MKQKKPYRDLRLRQGSLEWLGFRGTGIGGSEIASVMATDSKELAELVWTPPLKLHLEKLGEPIQLFTGNLATYEGHYQETAILHRFKYYDLERPDALLMHANMKEGLKINQVRKHRGVFQNPRWEFLFYSPDSVMLKDGKRCAVLESKLTTSMEAKRYSDRVNPAHYLQVMLGLMITELPIGYLISLVDGQWFEVTPIHPDKDVFEWIERTAAKFWINVLRAREIKVQYNIDAYFGVNPDLFTPEQREGVERLMELEPHLTGSEREVELIKSMIVPQTAEVPREGTQEEFEAAMNYLKATESIKELSALKSTYYNEMLRSLNGYNVINFPSGFYSYKADKNGKPAVYVSPKLKG